MADADVGAIGGSFGPREGSEAMGGVSRRSFIQTVGVSAAAGAVAQQAREALAKSEGGNEVSIVGPDPAPVVLRVNGRDLRLEIEPATTLLEALRVHLDLTGSKEICDRGSCGGCSVLLDGTLIASCMMLAMDAAGHEITTIEGLGADGELDPIQLAFIKHDALQCGYCTPGLVIAAQALLAERPRPSLDEIKRGLSGNLCRCGTYTNVFNAVLEASGQKPLRDSGES